MGDNSDPDGHSTLAIWEKWENKLIYCDLLGWEMPRRFEAKFEEIILRALSTTVNNTTTVKVQYYATMYSPISEMLFVWQPLRIHIRHAVQCVV